MHKLGLVRVWGFRYRKINFYLKILRGFSNVGTFQESMMGPDPRVDASPGKKVGWAG